jgi:hypothetical protein
MEYQQLVVDNLSVTKDFSTHGLSVDGIANFKNDIKIGGVNAADAILPKGAIIMWDVY